MLTLCPLPNCETSFINAPSAVMSTMWNKIFLRLPSQWDGSEVIHPYHVSLTCRHYTNRTATISNVQMVFLHFESSSVLNLPLFRRVRVQVLVIQVLQLLQHQSCGHQCQHCIQMRTDTTMANYYHVPIPWNWFNVMVFEGMNLSRSKFLTRGSPKIEKTIFGGLSEFGTLDLETG